VEPLLQRQLRRLNIDAEEPQRSPEALRDLLERVSETYAAAERSRYLLERSLEIASREMRTLYEAREIAAEARFERLFAAISDPVWTTTTDGHITTANEALADLVGLPQASLIGRSVFQFYTRASAEIVKESARDKLRDPSQMTRLDLDFVRADGAVVPAEVASQLLSTDGVAREFLVIARDVTEQRGREAALRSQAEHDALTGLPNRARLVQELELAIAKADSEPASLAMIDLDRFKHVNDTLGHEAGDAVLIAVASTIASAAGGHLAARLSGDEFVVLITGVEAKEAVATAERVRDALAFADIRVRGERIRQQISVGVAQVGAGDAPGDVLAAADEALYQAKNAGRNRVIVASGGDVSEQRDHFAQAEVVFDAIGDGRLELHYQPIVRLDTGEVAHYEALLRLRGLDGALVMPGAFLPAVEHVGASVMVDRCVASLVLDALRAHPEVHVFMNVSPSTIMDASLFEFLEDTFIEDPELATRLGIEITEAAALLEVEAARVWLERMNGWGCGIALDDFGMGYSFLNLARDLPITQLKIDGSSIRSFVDDPRERAVVRALQTLAAGLEITTVAEWIETPEQLALARDLGITYGQGYLLGRPAALPAVGERQAAA
jgi:diguanylate cyclase (GGDEF)-like protein/PAS domain S-box-containing protein